MIRQASSSCSSSSPHSWASVFFSYIHPSIHRSIHSSIHPPGNCVNYIPLQCHCFAASSHTITTIKKNHSGQDDRHTKKFKKGKQRISQPAHTLYFFKSDPLPLIVIISSSHIFFWSLMMKMKSEWSWAFFGWLSPSRVLSAGSGDMSPSPSARISASALGQSRSVSHSAGCP